MRAHIQATAPPAVPTIAQYTADMGEVELTQVMTNWLQFETLDELPQYDELCEHVEGIDQAEVRSMRLSTLAKDRGVDPALRHTARTVQRVRLPQRQVWYDGSEHIAGLSVALQRDAPGRNMTRGPPSIPPGLTIPSGASIDGSVCRTDFCHIRCSRYSHTSAHGVRAVSAVRESQTLACPGQHSS